MTDMKVAISAFRDGCECVGLTDAEIGAGLERAAPHLVPRGVTVDAGLRERMATDARAKSTWPEVVDAVLALVPTPGPSRTVPAYGLDDVRRLVEAARQVIKNWGWAKDVGFVQFRMENIRTIEEALDPFADQPGPAPQVHAPYGVNAAGEPLNLKDLDDAPHLPATLETLAREIAKRTSIMSDPVSLATSQFFEAFAAHQREEAARREQQRAAWARVAENIEDRLPTFELYASLAALAKEMQG